jgi:ADP-ribosylglycohydrolase
VPQAGSIALKDRVLDCLPVLWAMPGGGPREGKERPTQFEISAGPTISDDTQLTLATYESIIDRTAGNPENLAAHFLRWLTGRIRGMGSNTFKAMRDLSIGTDWALAGAPR